MTDVSFQALAAAGCGKNLTSLHLAGECPCFLFSLSSSFFLVFQRERTKREHTTDLPAGVTDVSLQALAAAGCGNHLTTLVLRSGFPSLLLFLSLLWLSQERNAGLPLGVTDTSFQGLATAGCGKKLQSLTLESECVATTHHLFCCHCCCFLKVAEKNMGD